MAPHERGFEMSTTHRRRWVALGAAFGAGVAAVVVSALAAFASSGAAASEAKPVNTQPPRISGTPQEGQTLFGDRGNWANTPTDYNWYWYRCNQNGGSCNDVGFAAGQHNYRLTAADVGKTIRLRIRARNGDGFTDATSVPTAVIAKSPTPPPPPPRGNGCPPGGNPDQVANIQGPANLIIDSWTQEPGIVGRSTTAWTFRVHVTSSCGGPVQGALVYGTATPYNQWTIPAEQPTGADGYATLTFQRLSGFPVSNHQELIAMFLRARKPGENVLNGITGYRLVSVPVDLNR
jgi:hypothetical protein